MKTHAEVFYGLDIVLTVSEQMELNGILANTPKNEHFKVKNDFFAQVMKTTQKQPEK